MPKVFIIVLHYKNWEDTNECLKSLENLDYGNYDTIIINNDKENKGYAGGNNVGIKQALEKGADYVLLLNNDVVVIEKDFLKHLVDLGESNKKIGILGPVIYEYSSIKSKEPKIHFNGGKVNWLYTKGRHKTGARDYITGACILIKREVIEKTGLLFEDYFLYLEDVDLCLRARKAGFGCWVAADSRISHKVSASTHEDSFAYIYYHTRNGLLLAKRNAPFFIKTFVYKMSILIYFKQLIKLVFLPSKKVWAKAIMAGIRDFYKGKLGKYEDRN